MREGDKLILFFCTTATLSDGRRKCLVADVILKQSSLNWAIREIQAVEEVEEENALFYQGNVALTEHFVTFSPSQLNKVLRYVCIHFQETKRKKNPEEQNESSCSIQR